MRISETVSDRAEISIDHFQMTQKLSILDDFKSHCAFCYANRAVL